MWSEKFSDLYHIAWGQAEFADYYKTKPTYERRNVVALEIFAEDIVRECISTIQNAENGYRDYRNQIEDSMRDHCIWLIKQKFGIEE